MVRNFLNCWDYPTGLGTGCRVEISPSDSKEELNDAARQNSVKIHGQLDTPKPRLEKSTKE